MKNNCITEKSKDMKNTENTAFNQDSNLTKQTRFEDLIENFDYDLIDCNSHLFTYHLRDELTENIIKTIQDCNTDLYDLHFHAFNEDYYIIGYYLAEKWLEKHNISAFEAMEAIRTYEQDNFGETLTKCDNAETTVNMLVYILGEDIINNNPGIFQALIDAKNEED